ncbi:MAG: PKD-like domain-containing protein, partial [Bacteroidota bacterium]
MKNHFYRLILPLFFCLLPLFNRAEGTKQARPPLTKGIAGLTLTTGTTYSDFAQVGCAADYRLNIRIREVTEKILFGFKKQTASQNINFNLRDPLDNIVLTGIIPTITGSPGYITDTTEAYIGPFPALLGYTPLEYIPLMTGDYYFEFFIPPSSAVNGQIEFFDITVLKTGYQTPAAPNDVQDGRVWSKSWQFNSGSTSPAANQYYSGKMYVYSDDAIVTLIDFNNLIGGTFTVYCNPYGCQNTANAIEDRKSRMYNYKLPQYKVFMNDPDSLAFPSGNYGTISSSPPPSMIPALPPCSGNETITFSVDKAGKVDITLDFPNPYVDVLIAGMDVLPGVNSFSWNGLDGTSPVGVPVPDGVMVIMSINYINGLTNLPLFDVEYTANPNFPNDQGIKVSLIRPTSPSLQNPRMYWDDTLVKEPVTPPYTCEGTTNMVSGCVPTPGMGCHLWENCIGEGIGHNGNTINTWWYAANTSTSGISVVHSAQPPNPVGFPAARCGQGSVTLSATVLNYETVDWYNAPTGGTLLLTGSTSYTTPVLSSTQTFYAEARNTVSSCLSPQRTAIVATINPIPPSPGGVTSVMHCGPGTVTFTAIAGAGEMIDWYDLPVGGTILASSTLVFTTPVLSSTTSYYALAKNPSTGCIGTSRTTFTAAINPIPAITNSPASKSICSGQAANIALLSSLPGTTFNWIIKPGNCIGITPCPSAGSGSLINDILNLSTANAGNVTYSIIPFLNGCYGDTLNYSVTVNPYPVTPG